MSVQLELLLIKVSCCFEGGASIDVMLNHNSYRPGDLLASCGFKILYIYFFLQDYVKRINWTTTKLTTTYMKLVHFCKQVLDWGEVPSLACRHTWLCHHEAPKHHHMKLKRKEVTEKIISAAVGLIHTSSDNLGSKLNSWVFLSSQTHENLSCKRHAYVFTDSRSTFVNTF